MLHSPPPPPGEVAGVARRRPAELVLAHLAVGVLLSLVAPQPLLRGEHQPALGAGPHVVLLGVRLEHGLGLEDDCPDAVGAFVQVDILLVPLQILLRGELLRMCSEVTVLVWLASTFHS